MPCLSTSKPTAPSTAALAALRRGTCSRGSRAITQAKISQLAARPNSTPDSREQDFRPRLLGQPEKRQHRPGECGQQAGDRERDGQGEPQTEQRQQVEQHPLHDRGRRGCMAPLLCESALRRFVIQPIPE